MPARTLAAMCVGLITACLPGSAWGDMLPIICHPSGVAEGVVAGFGAVPRGAGLAGEAPDLALAELMISPDGRWAWLLRLPDGRTCAVASGSDWQELAAPVEDRPS